MSIFERFRSDRRGNVAMTFALVMVPVIGAAGAAIDYARVAQTRAKLANALDAAVLAVASQPEMSDAKAFAVVNDWVKLHMGDAYSGTWKLDSVTQSKDGAISASASGVVDTTLVRVLGIDDVDIGVVAEAVRSIGKVELVLVLDNTGSMSRNNKIGKLKDAASLLVDTLAKSSKNPNDLKIGLVPFSQTVNVGPGYANAAWLDAAGKSDSAKSLFLGETVNRINLFKTLGETWGGCVETRAMPYETSGAAPVPGNPDTLYVPYFAPDEPGKKGEGGKGKYNNSYLDDTPIEALLGKLGIPIPDSELWKYLQSTIFKYDGGKPYSGSTAALGYDYGPNSGCDLAPLQRLTTDKDKVKTAIAGMNAEGNTDIPVGAVWGWNVLAPDGPFGDGVAWGEKDWTKIAVIMTDGNNENEVANEENESYYSGVGYIWQGRMGATSASKAKRTELRDKRLGEICANMKAKGVIVYTVRVEVKAGSSAVLENCASDSAKFYDVEKVAELAGAFEDIGDSIQALRLAK